jgi:hypothetical protein
MGQSKRPINPKKTLWEYPPCGGCLVIQNAWPFPEEIFPLICSVFFARGISPGQKWWGTLFGREISCSQWEGPSMPSRCLTFFPYKFWGGFFSFSPGSQSVLSSLQVLNSSLQVLNRSHQVPNVFLNMFSIAPHFCPICFGKCCPPFTYIAGPKGNIICQSRTFYFGDPSIVLIFLRVIGKSNWLVPDNV